MNIKQKILRFIFTNKLISKILLNTSGRVYYVGSFIALPAPLDAKTEAEYIALSESGNAEARQKLIEHNLRLVVYISKRFENTGIMSDDLISIGSIGLIKAIKTFKSDKNIKLATYASRCIENEILMFLRKSNVQRNEISLDEPLNIDWDGNELLLSDILGTDSDSIYKDLEYDVEKEMLKDALSKLTPREKQIMEMRFGLNSQQEMTQKEVADNLGISQSYISRLEKKIIQRLRKEIEKIS